MADHHGRYSESDSESDRRMKYQLVYMEKTKEAVQEFDVFLDALKEAVRMREESDAKVLGIKEKDLGGWQYVLRTGQISAVEMALIQVKDWWKE